MTEAKPKRRWFQFSLRALLVLVSIVAIGSWAYWVAWPWWQAYREQAQFEAAVRQLKISGFNPASMDRLPKQTSDSQVGTGDAKFNYIVGKYVRANASYCIVFTDHWPTEPRTFQPIKIAAYRLQHAPIDYRPYRDHDVPNTGRLREIKHVEDFADFILGDPEDGRHFEYELIYSDPPEIAKQ